METEWRAAIVRLRDSIIYCGGCGAENFYDRDALSAGAAPICWACQKLVQLPPRIRLDKTIVMLNQDTALYPHPHHVDNTRRYDFSQPVAQVARHPTNPDLWGLKNLSEIPWIVTIADSKAQEVPPGRSISLAAGTRINFGRCEGEIRP